MEKDVYWLWFADLKGFGSVRQNSLLSRWPDAEAIFMEEESKLAEFILKEEGFGKKDLVELCQSKKKIKEYQKEYQSLRKEGIRIINRTGADYPEKLRDIASSPAVFYVKGIWEVERWQSGISLGVVGTRNMTHYGKNIAMEIGRLCAKYKVNMVSGMAAGIDGHAQRACLKHGGYTLGVLGSGLGFQFPSSNKDLYLNIEKRGGLLSEEWYTTPPYGKLFPKRNRIISALSDGIIVVEAKEKSGSLITADYALEQGKDIYAVPGRLGDTESAGCNHLIAQGAFILEDLESFFVQFTGNKNNIQEKCQVVDKLDEAEREIFQHMSYEPIYLGRLLEKTGMEQGELQLSLLQMEWKGYIEQISAGYYSLIRQY